MKSHSITNRVLKGIGSTGLSQVISFGSSVLLVPLFLRAWGSEQYGNWLALTAFISYITLLDLGGQSYIGNLLAGAFARHDDYDFQSRLSEGVSLFLIIAFCAFVGLIVLVCIPGIMLPGRKIPLNVEERGILFSMGSLLLLTIPSGVYVTIYRATGRLARGMMLGNVFRLFSLCVYCLVLLLYWSPVWYAIINLFCGVFLTVGVIWDTHRQIPASRHIRINWSSAYAGPLHLSGSIFFWILSLSYAINFQGVILVLGSLTSTTAVALYSTHRTAAGFVNYIYNLMLAPLWPEFTFMHAQGMHEELKKALLLVVRVVVLLSGLCAIALVWMLPVIYPFWTGKRLDFNSCLLIIFLLQGVLAAGWNASGWSLLASNQHRRLAVWALLNAIITISLSVIGAIHNGVVGVAIATLTGDIICGLMVYPALGAKALGMPIRKMYLSIMRPIIALCIPIVALIVLSKIVEGLIFLYSGCFVLIVCSGISILLTFGMDEFVWLKNQLMVRRGMK